MTDKEIFQKALKKAHDNGYGLWIGYNLAIENSRFYNRADYNGCCYEGSEGHINEIIFDHDFCNAFFGEGMRYNYWNWPVPFWKECLQVMVLEKEPLKYLEKFL